MSSALRSDGDGEAGFTDTIRPHGDYGSRLNPDCLQRLVPMLLRIRHKTLYRQPGFLTPASYIEFEPRHSPFFYQPPSAEYVTAPIPAGASLSHTLPFPGEAFQFITELIKQASSGLFLEADCHAQPYCSTLLSLFQFPYVCRSVSPCGALPALCFHAEYNSEFKVYSLGVDEHAGTGYSFAFVGKNLQTSLPCGRSACIFSGKCGTPLFSLRAGVSTSEQTSNCDYTH